ncbi:MAG: UPF0149 family protein [Marinomonas sp.]
MSRTATSTEMLKDALDFDLIADVFVSESITASPAELHGQLCGYLASGVTLLLEDWLTMVAEFCDIEGWKEDASRAAIVELYTATLTLFQNGEYALVPSISDDDAELCERGVTLSQWAHGFLAGYGLSGQKNTLSDETKQILRDFANISGMQAEMRSLEDSNDNEADLTELVEYVRLSAMMMYSEHHDVNPDADHTKKNPLH